MEPLNLRDLDVLVVEDNTQMQDLLKTMLAAMHITRVRFHDNATTAFRAVCTDCPDIVITDYHMQPINGLDFVRQLRRSPDSPNPRVPIILLTAYADKQCVIDARDVGVHEILAKPVSIKALYDRIVDLIEHPRPFVRSPRYVGPDRRRCEKAFDGPEQRHTGTSAEAAEQQAETSSDDELVFKEHVPS